MLTLSGSLRIKFIHFCFTVLSSNSTIHLSAHLKNLNLPAWMLQALRQHLVQRPSIQIISHQVLPGTEDHFHLLLSFGYKAFLLPAYPGQYTNSGNMMSLSFMQNELSTMSGNYTIVSNDSNGIKLADGDKQLIFIPNNNTHPVDTQ